MTPYVENVALFAKAGASDEDSIVDEVITEMQSQWQFSGFKAMQKWSELLVRPVFARHPKVLEAIGGWLAEWPEGSKDLARVLVDKALECARCGPVSTLARERFARASQRKIELGFAVALDLAIIGLPESLTTLERYLEDLRCHRSDLLMTYLERIGRCADEPARRRAYRLLLSQAFVPLAGSALEGLPPNDEVWEELGHAALARPALHLPFLRFLAQKGEAHIPKLREFLFEMAHSGTLETEARVRSLLGDLPDGRPPEGSPPQFWSREDRQSLSALASGGPVTPEGKTALERLIAQRKVGAHDLALEVCRALVPRLHEGGVGDLLMMVSLESRMRSSMEFAAMTLVERLAKDPDFSIPEPHRRLLHTERAGLGGHEDSRLALTRLGLPFTRQAWIAARNRFVTATEVEHLDLALGLRYAEIAPECLEHVIESSSPNQRRLLLRSAPLDRFPKAIPELIDLLERFDLAAISPLMQRLAEVRPPGFVDHLVALARNLDKTPALRSEALRLIVAHGGPAHIAALSNTKDETFVAARKALRARLQASGEDLSAGQLAIAADTGGLALASDISDNQVTRPQKTRKSRHSKLVSSDLRLSLLPPPRRLGLAVELAHYLLGASGSGPILVIAAVGVAFFVQSMEGTKQITISTIFLSIPVVASACVLHSIWRTFPTLRALRHGTLLTAKLLRRWTDSTTDVNRYRYAVELLDAQGRIIHHEFAETRELQDFVDEEHEPVLVVFTDKGDIEHLVPVDTLRLARIAPEGRFVPTRLAWSWLTIILFPFIFALCDIVF